MADRTKSPGRKVEASGAAKKEESAGAMPEIDESGFLKFVPLFVAFLTIPRAMCLGIAVAIYKYGATEVYDKNMATLKDRDLGYLYLSAIIMGFVVSWVNNYPMLYKNMVMRQNSGNLRANMMIYKEAGAANAPYVVLETEGAVGSYNRANRSLTHFTETSGAVIVCMALAGYIFPFPAMICTAIYGLGRILHQAGYAKTGYGGHAAGFMLSMFSDNVLQMLCLVVAAKSLGLAIGPLRTEL
eukprot:TRINITY_DN52805_c0_g1_i1.p1 TRINITY_DN52805_c0_g1~~TRINITY_DN52805_c0_g1_i1.p1  ORF type:complete len:242 (-),score=53.22 TRINITY_DN52805_c0_g1_i1:45-770(-)